MNKKFYKIKNEKKITISRTIIFTLTVALFLLTSCNTSSHQKGDEVFGVITTMGNKAKSYIDYYDKNLELVITESLKYAELGGITTAPVYVEDSIFILPRGNYYEGYDNKVLEINKKTFDIETYEFKNYAFMSLAADEGKIYTVMTEGPSPLARIEALDRKNGELKEVSLKGLANYMYSTGKKLFVFYNTYSADEPMSFVDIYTSELDLIETINLNQYGSYQNNGLLLDEFLYIPTPRKLNDDESNLVLKININDFKIECIELNESLPFEILHYKNSLLISHYDYTNQNQENSKLTILNLETGEQIVKNLDRIAEKIEVYEDSLYVFNQEKITKYDLSDNLKKIKEVDINMRDVIYFSTVINLKQHSN
ncbi:MAG: hypothetical protein GX219_00130 [Tissierellia bacterium]|nr:hypothetical protein [Tissierellia bacterium]